MGQNTGKSDVLVWFHNFNKSWGCRDRLLYFIVENYKYKHLKKLNLVEHWDLNHRQLCLYCASIKKENTSSFLIAKMYEIDFYQQLRARVCSKNQKQFVWTWKVIQNNWYCPASWAKYRILQFNFQGFCLREKMRNF